MRNILIILFFAFSTKTIAQRSTYGSISGIKITFHPAVNNGDLCETLYIEKHSKFLMFKFYWVETCTDFREFKRNYPSFHMPVNVRNRFKRCK